MTLLPFVCLGLGVLLGMLLRHRGLWIRLASLISSVALWVLLLSIGLSIGTDESLIRLLPSIGLSSIIISFSGIFFSVLLVKILEKCFRLESYQSEMQLKGESSRDTLFMFMMPLTLALGVFLGRLGLATNYTDALFTGSLVALYTSVGMSQGSFSVMLRYFKQVGLKVLTLPLVILLGTLMGGFVSGVILGIPLRISIISASGMGYYSLTGAFMSATGGIEAGSYGFMVNVFRDILTVVLLPLLIKISPASPIASGAAGNMDTMFGPVSRATGKGLGLLILMVGTVLTILVPVLLPILSLIL